MNENPIKTLDLENFKNSEKWRQVITPKNFNQKQDLDYLIMKNTSEENDINLIEEQRNILLD